MDSLRAALHLQQQALQVVLKGAQTVEHEIAEQPSL